jgi:hypothetical protein
VKVVVELTDEQANRWASVWENTHTWDDNDPYKLAAVALRDAIVAARPRTTDRACPQCGTIRSSAKPLKIGDYIRRRNDLLSCEVLGFGTFGPHTWVAVMGREIPFMVNPHGWTMPDGSPIVWPTDG